MSGDLPPGFLRAEAAWLQPPDDEPFTREDIDDILGHINSVIHDFIAEQLFDVEESGQIDDVILAAKDLIGKLDDLRDELQNAEENQEYEPDPDAEYDRRAEMGA